MQGESNKESWLEAFLSAFSFSVWTRCSNQTSPSGHKFYSSDMVLVNENEKVVGKIWHHCQYCGKLEEQIVTGLMMGPRTPFKSSEEAVN